MAAPALADRQAVAVAQRAPAQAAEARAQVGAARAEHRQHVDAARHAQITAHAVLRDLQHERLPGRDRQAPPRMHAPAVEHGAEAGAGDRDARGAREAEAGGADRDLDGRRRGAVADQPVADLERQRVERAAQRHAQVTKAAPAGVLHRRQRPGAQHLDAGGSGALAHDACTSRNGEAYAVARLQQGGRRLRGIEQGQGGAADQLPAAGRGGRVDAGLRAADADRAGRHLQARRGAARRVQGRLEPAEIGEAGLETDEEHDVAAGRVTFDHLAGGQPGMRGDRREIGAGLAAVAHRDLDLAARRGIGIGLAPGGLEPRQQRRRRGLERIEHHREIVHARHHVEHLRPAARERRDRPDPALAVQRGGRRRFADESGVA